MACSCLLPCASDSAVRATSGGIAKRLNLSCLAAAALPRSMTSMARRVDLLAG
eukprot:CAMPEP_0171103562 /NCGR_PEP_ID=MMETSP0766_2-20121228/58986_1 /TAXON_ID=439317 /ORGANISM="Gambierdiscus australes, Strain CAWD 149" /LENGTH=52 /DNA_ID=CAMNT_0011563997 /DNA_START=558 /DNA_END=712 /DNA_ORIENTATION=+